MKRFLTGLTLSLLILAGAFLFRKQLYGVIPESFYPFLNAARYASLYTSGSLRTAMNAAKDSVTREELLREIDRLTVIIRQQDELAAENEKLRRELGALRSMAKAATPAPVLSSGGMLGVWKTIRVGKGSLHGIAPDNPVVVPDGLVGRVTSVTPHTAEILLITNPDCQVAAELALAGDENPVLLRGIVTGGGGRPVGARGALSLMCITDPLRLRYLKKDAEIIPRTPVVTSGLGELFPPGIPVGWIVESYPAESGLYIESTVLPAVDFASLTTVYVLTAGGGVSP